MCRNIYLAISVLAGFSSVSSAAQDLNLDQVKALPSGINTVVSGGYWSLDSDEGFYRVVMTAGGFEHVIYRLYLQWLKIGGRDHDNEVLQTLPVEELNRRFGVIDAIKIEMPNVVSGMATSRSDDTPRGFTIILNVDGTYEVAIQQ